MVEPVLRVENLHVTYRVSGGSFEALHDINFELSPGDILGVVGESGCGKSTLSSAILQLLPANGRISGGHLFLHGQDLLSLSERELRHVRGGQIAMVFQDPLTSLNPTFKVSTQMINAQSAHADAGQRGSRELRERAVRMLERVGIPEPERRIDHYPHQFSGGMRQRIMVATALLLRPEVLICDEATSALDVTLQAQILQMVRELCSEQGTAVVVISHDIGVISEMCDNIVVLYAGRVVEAGTVEATLTRPQHPYTRKLIDAVPSRHRRDERLSIIPGRVPNLAALPSGCTFAPRCHAAQPVCEEAEPPIVVVGDQQVRCLLDVRDAAPALDTATTSARPAASQDRGDPETAEDPSLLVDVRDLRIHFTDRRSMIGAVTRRSAPVVRAVDGVSLTLGRAEIVGLVGESGSGKTTLGKALLNLVPITGGSVAFDGTPLAELGAGGWRRMRRQMQMIFQEPYGSLSPRLRVERLITEPYRINKTSQEGRYQVDELLELVGLSSEQATKYPHELSGGQARRVGVARALAVQPRLLVADEPTAGLDVSAAGSILNLLQDLRAQLSLTMLIITHDLNVVGYVADRIGVMQQGKIVEVGTVDDIMDTPQDPYTKKLLASIPDISERRRQQTPMKEPPV